MGVPEFKMLLRNVPSVPGTLSIYISLCTAILAGSAFGVQTCPVTSETSPATSLCTELQEYSTDGGK